MTTREPHSVTSLRSHIEKTIIQIVLFLVLIELVSCIRTNHPTVVINTDMGEISVEVFDEKAPLTASNFLDLVERGVYTNAVFYRVVRMNNQPQNKVKIEVIQGGLHRGSLINTYPPIAHETTEVTGIKHTDGVISMARNEPGSASTEFFICIGDQPSLDYGGDRNPDGEGFAAFGKVIRGMDVVRAIQAMPDSVQIIIDKVRIQEMKLAR